MIDKFLKSPVGIIIISIIWGLGLATLFKRSCDNEGTEGTEGKEGKECKVIEIRGPAVSNTGYYWKYSGDNKCYVWEPYLTKCAPRN